MCRVEIQKENLTKFYRMRFLAHPPCVSISFSFLSISLPLCISCCVQYEIVHYIFRILFHIFNLHALERTHTFHFFYLFHLFVFFPRVCRCCYTYISLNQMRYVGCHYHFFFFIIIIVCVCVLRRHSHVFYDTFWNCVYV